MFENKSKSKALVYFIEFLFFYRSIRRNNSLNK